MNNTRDSSSSPPRHWHGSVGDRYEHHNVWVTGGPPGPYRRPSFLESFPIDHWVRPDLTLVSCVSSFICTASVFAIFYFEFQVHHM
ncbi:hypothetical protein P168DRAFT_41583 [Aspergillus campestris IBT 28561]|uniref:Uncharacterized protein n=1 Tax=Aspergillus campestris (strain IBT 28561) TaxID=1392248 RepID=A0A2I1CWY0_ASPC2|nr:uncharacterized protein P168DRAFT_41583 [Aspergillus campestris IBT 28561]PKY02127.1 hypothetical protein P168DRAFT_41583 [Aspergillus campestris IBT 28561]